MKYLKYVPFFLLGINIANAAQPTTAFLSNSVEKKDKFGLFWYDAPKKEAESKEEEKWEKPIIPEENIMFSMHPKDLEKLLDQTRDYAIYKLTPEATLDYYKVLDVSRRKAAAFTSLTGYVMLEKPELNAAQQFPITNPGNAERLRISENLVVKQLQEQRENFALLFFTQPGCGYCVQQSQILENFQRETGWYIKNVNIIEQPQARAKFNITGTPVTVIINKNSANDQWMPVSVGVDSLSNLKSNVYRVTRLFNGEIDARQFYTNAAQSGGFFDPIRSPQQQ
ncbi:conjugal transfer protein TraF [Dickeya sp. NCPPB 3274]|uniref:conjugal transfer protein TraF n=1 Tax=Dickeya sp. NCPPB 3274 TaxID=568766 RepID=UPI0003A9D92B|nr:conjugal transfer protein TraF [Dickeya sp. NCPPB 3274]